VLLKSIRTIFKAKKKVSRKIRKMNEWWRQASTGIKKNLEETGVVRSCPFLTSMKSCAISLFQEKVLRNQRVKIQSEQTIRGQAAVPVKVWKPMFVCTILIVFILAFSFSLYSSTVTIIHTNDTHGKFRPFEIESQGKTRLVGGMEAVSHYINLVRKSDENVLVIDKGDMMTGTFASAILYKEVVGGIMVEFLNRLDFDLWNLGNHEFDNGQANALGLTSLAEFPTILANLVYSDDKRLFLDKPYCVFDSKGLKVGVIAVMEENFLVEVHREQIQGLEVLPMVPTLQSYVQELDEQTDLIIVVVHSRYDDGLKVAQSVSGIDVVLCASEEGRFEDVNGVLVQSTIGHQHTLGYLKLEVDGDEVVDYEQKLIWLWADVDLNPSPQITSLVREVEESIGEECTRVIGKTESDLKKIDYPVDTQIVDSSLGNWITDVMRWKTKTQIALHNSGAIRASLSAGEICIQDIFEVAPFNNTLVVFKLNGKQIKEILEVDIDRQRDRLQVSGLTYKYHPKNDSVLGQRVDHLEIEGDVIVKDGRILLPDKTYTVVSNDYVVGHATDKYFGFPVLDATDTLLPLDQALVEWLEKYKVISAKNETRIVRIVSIP